MLNNDTKYIDKSIKVLSQALKADESPKSIEHISSSLKGICKLLNTRPTDAARQSEASCILAAASKYCLVEACLHFLGNSVLEENVVCSTANGLARIFCIIVHKAPSGDSVAFIDHLAQSCFLEVFAQCLLPYFEKNLLRATLSAISTMENIVKVGIQVYSRELDQEQRGLGHLAELSLPVQNSYRNFLISVFLYMKLLLHSHFTSFGPPTQCIQGAYSSNPSSHSCGQCSRSSHIRTPEPQDKHSQDAFIQQQVLQLHRHLLQAVKLLEPTFESLVPWKNMRGILLEEDLLSIPFPRNTLKSEEPYAEWDLYVNAIHLLLEMSRLKGAPRPLKEVVIEMALDVMTALRACSFVQSQSYVRTLGEQIWQSIQRTTDAEWNVRLAVRLFFTVQLNLEAACSFCGLGASNDDLAQRARPVNEYPEYRGTRSAALRIEKRQATEAIAFREEVLETVELLHVQWMLAFANEWKHDLATRAVRCEVRRILSEEACEMLLERQIRWFCRPQLNWIPARLCFCSLNVSAMLLKRILHLESSLCVSCHLSLCATLSKVATPLIKAFHGLPETGTTRALCASALRNLAGVFSMWCLTSLSESRLCALIEAMAESSLNSWFAMSLTDLRLSALIQTADHSSLEAQGSRLERNDPEPGNRAAKRYIPGTEISVSECTTFVFLSLHTSMNILAQLTEEGHVTKSTIELSSETLKLLACLLKYLHRHESIKLSCWYVSLLLQYELVPLLKRIYITAPQEVCNSQPTELATLDWRIPHLLYHIKMLVMTGGHSCMSMDAMLTSRLLKAGLFDDLLSILVCMTPNLDSNNRSLEFPKFTLDILKAPTTAIWALCWITFYKILHEVCIQLLGESPLPELLYPMCNMAWEQLPCLMTFIEEGTCPWVVLTDRGRIIPESPYVKAGESSAQYQLAKLDMSGKVDHSLFFLPWPEIPKIAIGRIRAWGQKMGGDVKQSGLGTAFIFPRESKRPPIPVGCWSRRCVNISGHSEASLPTHICARCRMARYCCRSCQRADWLQHKKDCRPWEEAVKRQSVAQ